MCGFLASFSRPEIQLDQQLFEYSLKKIHFRGPDSSNVIAYKDHQCNVILGHNRLSIIDPHPRSSQPMERGHGSIVFNGEIYNFKQLRSELLDHGHNFETQGDTEVLITGLLQFGASWIKKIEGIFSFVFFDKRKRLIIVARDQAGIKPMFFFRNENFLTFASELTPLQIYHHQFEISQEASWFYFKVGFGPPGISFIQNIFKVNPGEVSTYSLVDFKKIDSFYLNELICPHHRIDKKIVIPELRDDVNSTIESELVSDVPVGVLLSGGVDSSIVAKCAKKNVHGLHTFTAAYESESDSKFNFDAINAQRFSKSLGTVHHQVDINNSRLCEEIESYFSSLDEPTSSFTSFSTFKVIQYARKLDVRVLLTGDGADEVFGGYERYRHAKKISKLSFLLRLIPKYKDYVGEDAFTKYVRFYEVFKNSEFRISNKEKEEMKGHLISFFPPIIQKVFAEVKELSDLINYLDFLIWLPEESNQRVDRSSMRSSVEVRVPFQSKRLVDKYLPISLDKKVSKKMGKVPLREAFSDLPDYILNATKRGWDGPYSRWFRQELSPLINDYLGSSLAGNLCFFEKNYFQEIYLAHCRGEYFKNEMRVILGYLLWLNGQQKLKNFANGLSYKVSK